MANTRRKRNLLVLCLLLFALCLGGCATVPPQIIGGAPTQAPTETPEAATEAPTVGDETGAPVEAATEAPQAQQGATGIAANAPVPPSRVELLYSGTPSMMGFADAPRATIYENVMDALPACVSLLWPQADVSYYRYGADIGKESMVLDKATLLSHIGEPYFYRDTPLMQQPARLKREGQPLVSEAVNLNEPVPSFYDKLGLAAPSARSAATGTPVAVTAADPAQDALSIIVTDLHELRMDDGALLTALNERSLQTGRTVGIAAITSEFAGYIPDIGTNNTTFVWGSPPNGTLDYLLDYTDYAVGVSIDPEAREMATRPFYVLVIGEQGAVNSYLQTLAERLQREFSGNNVFRMHTAVFGSGYVPEGYTLGGNMRYLAGQGVTAVADQAASGGVSLIELKASQEARFLEWEADYTVHASDPRGAALSADDFIFMAEAVAADGTRTPLPNLTWAIRSVEGSRVTLSLRLDLPAGILPQGGYTLELSGSLTAPENLPGSDWLALYGYDADGAQLYDMEQNVTAFDGSRTLFLSRLIDTLGKANIGRLGIAPLGTVQITLTVYA